MEFGDFTFTPVHGLMHRGFVRDWLTDELIAAHKPFIKAIRSIALSPFAILFGASIILILVYLLAFGIEQILLRVNLLRENPYAKVPLVHAVNSDFYDPSMHDIDEQDGHDRNNKDIYFGNSSTSMAHKRGNTDEEANENANENEKGGNAVTGADNYKTALSLEAGIIDVDLELEKLEENLAKKKNRGQIKSPKMKSPKIGSPKRTDHHNYKKDGEKTNVPESEEHFTHN